MRQLHSYNALPTPTPQKYSYIQGERNHMVIALLMRCCLLQYKTNTALDDAMFPNGKTKQFYFSCLAF